MRVGNVGDRDTVAGLGGETLAGISGLLLGGRNQAGKVVVSQCLLDRLVDGKQLTVGLAVLGEGGVEDLVAGQILLHQRECLERVIGTVADEDGPVIGSCQPVHEVGPQLVLAVEFPQLTLVMKLDQAENGDVALATAVMVGDFRTSLAIIVLPSDHPRLVFEELGIGQAAVVVVIPPVGEAELVAVVDIVEPVVIEVGDDSLLAVPAGDKVVDCQSGLVEEAVNQGLVIVCIRQIARNNLNESIGAD